MKRYTFYLVCYAALYAALECMGINRSRIKTESIIKIIFIMDASIEGCYRGIPAHLISSYRSLEKQIDSLDVEDRHYDRKLSDLQDRLDKMYDNIDDMEKSIAVCRDRKKAIEAEKLTGDNVYKVLIYFDKLYAIMEDADKRNLLSALIDEIQVYEEEQDNGQWLKSIGFKLPIIDSEMDLSLDNDSRVETVVLMSKIKEK